MSDKEEIESMLDDIHDMITFVKYENILDVIEKIKLHLERIESQIKNEQ